jgi:hypothetical protein
MVAASGLGTTTLLPEVPSSPHLAADSHPVAVELDLPGLTESIMAVEAELGTRAALDKNMCCGYFPALRGVQGIDCVLPACRSFSDRMPSIDVGGRDYQFNFIRLSLTRQSVDPAFHLDSDAATALTGDVTTLRQRRVMRLLLNLSSISERDLHFLDVDPYSVDLTSDGSYVRVADPIGLSDRIRTAIIPARRGSCVSGLVFAANSVLHSGVDSVGGHFVAAYGIETRCS